MSAANESAALQADLIERGAEKYLAALLTQEGEDVQTLSEDYFAAVPVGEGFFWVLRPQYDDPQLPLFGMTSESSKLNINTASFDQLSMLPGIDYTAASSIMDWRDTDENVERDGAESDYYASQQEAYYCKNASFDTVEELLLVRGVTRQMLYGDGSAEPLGLQSSLTARSVTSLTLDPQIARGFYDLLTIHSMENNTSADGQPRININNNNRAMRVQLSERLRQRLTRQRADQIVTAIGTSDMRDIFVFYQRARLTKEEFDLIADDLTTTNSRTLRGRININTAPRDVLLTLSGLESADVDKLLAARPTVGASADLNALGWIVDAITVQKAASARLGTQITTHTAQWSADILAVSGNGRAFKRCRVVFDNISGTPQIVYRRDITDRGWPMETSVLESIRAGQGPGMAIGRLGSMSQPGGVRG